ncbi:MAG: penicillin-binding protein 2 [Actinobacteria bacterium]|nr:penicillin-binding protein 2 [Actinomycetota bacterium]
MSLSLPATSRRAVVLSVSLALLLGGCTPDDGDEAPPRDMASEAAAAAEDVFEALSEADESALSELSDPVDAGRIIDVLEASIEDGEITDVGFSVSGEPSIEPETGDSDLSSSPTAPSAEASVPYEVAWTSEIGGDTTTFSGELLLSEAGDGWMPRLGGAAQLFPGVPGAKGWAVGFKWLPRGRILDRHGAVLAKGSSESRSYPQGSTAGTTIGHLGVLTAKDVEDGALGAPGDVVGASGLEGSFQERLAGTPERRLALVDRKGRKIETVARDEGALGKDLKTTLDLQVQRAAEAAYGGTVGGSVIMKPQTGDLLAVVSSSPFDPNGYVGAADVEPFNRALSGLYPPGSAMKVMTAAGALDSKTVTASTIVTGPAEYQGVRNFESGEFGSIPFSSAVKFSVNTAFAQVAEDMGAKKLTQYAEAFGFNAEPDIDFASTSSFPFPDDLGDLMWASVGQAQTLASPMQMASVAATIANGGRRMEPRIAMHIEPHGKRAVSAKVAATMTTLMESVVEGGTGVNAQIAGVRVAGKTGTAEVDVGGERKNHAWFVAFAPAGAPVLAVSVVSEYGGVGGQVAAPLARSIMQSVLPLLP